MRVRNTSIEAYNIIKDNGLLSRLRFQVYDYVFHHGPSSIRDAARHFKNQYSNSLSTRFSELRDLGLLDEIGEKQDPQSLKRVIIWDVTDKLPIKTEKAIRSKCNACGGSGYISEQQLRFRL